MPGVTTESTYDPVEFRAAGNPAQFLAEPVTIEEGQDLVAGTVIGERVTSGKYVAYDNDGVATATAPTVTEGDANGSISSVAVQDDYTLTEDWEVECTTAGGTGVGKFKITGSVTGESADDVITVGTQYSLPATAAYKIRLTVSDGSEDWEVGDKFTFSTVAAKALVAKKILTEDVDATDGDRISSGYVKGNFVYSKLTGIDSNAVTDLNGVYDSDTDRLRIN